MANIIGDVHGSQKFGGVRANVLSMYLTTFDTLFLVDDSGTMTVEKWKNVERALLGLAAEVAKFDGDGVSVRFLNDPTEVDNTKSPGDILRAFSRVTPRGMSNVGRRLKTILDDYISQLLRALTASAKAFYDVKPLNVIVLTDGNFTEEPEEIVAYIRPIIAQLKVLRNPEDLQRRVGIQLVQVGNDPAATETLQSLDDAFKRDEDIIDTTPWNEQLSPETLFKILLGAIHEKLDETAPPPQQKMNVASPTPVPGPAYPGRLSSNEQAFFVPLGQTCEISAQSNAYLWQRVTISTSPFTPGFPRVLEGQGEGRPMSSNGSTTIDVINGGNSWIVIGTEFSNEFGAVRRYMPSSSKLLSNEIRGGRTCYMVGADDGGVTGVNPDGDYNDTVVRVVVGPA